MLSQQPAGHEVASQTHLPAVASHRWPDEHALQAAPANPQAADVGVMHCPSLQQPSGQDVLLQTHCPPAQAWPDAHEAQTDPLRPQTPSVMEVTQWPFESQQPDAQVAALHVSADPSTELLRASAELEPSALDPSGEVTT